MKALTIHQPWAWAIAQGHKRIENRSWYTSHRGSLLIHAGRSIQSIESGRRYIERLGLRVPDRGTLVFGAIVAIARVKACVEVETVLDEPFAEGPVCWLLTDVRAVDPFPYSGAQGLFEVPESVVDQLRLLDGSRVVGVGPPYPSWKPGALPLS